MSSPQPAPPAAPRQSGRSRLFLYATALGVLAAAVGYYGYMRQTNSVQPIDAVSGLRRVLANLPLHQKLDEAYRDADGDLVADPPTEASKLQKVEEIGFCVVPGDDAKQSQDEWKDFMAALAKATGKKVTYVAEVRTDSGQLAALREGQLHVTAFGTGEVPTAVNTAGFVPLACPADPDGKYAYEMEILVPAGSTVKSPGELKDKTVAFTALSSNSGAKAPMVKLKEEFGLLPGRDYRYRFTGGHQTSLRLLADGQFDAVCVANDVLARMVQQGEIKPAVYRSIYKSSPFPPLCLGMAHDLPPEMRAQIKQVLSDFRFEGTSLAKQFAGQGKTRFAPVDYKRDWAPIRAIDEALSQLIAAK